MVTPARIRQQGSGARSRGRFGAVLARGQDLLPLLAQLPQPAPAPALLAPNHLAMEHAMHDPCALFVSQVFVGFGALSIGLTQVDELLLEFALFRGWVLFGQVLGAVSPIFGLIDERELADALLDAPMHLRIDDAVCACILTHQFLGNAYAGGDRPHIGPKA